MKKVKAVLLWILSVFFVILSFSLLTVGVLPFLGLFICAVLTNPLFINRVKIKKGVTFLIVLALFIVSFSMVPAKDGDNLAINAGSTMGSDLSSTLTENKREVLRVLPDRITEWTDSADSPSIDEAPEKETHTSPSLTPTDEPTVLAMSTPVVRSSPEIGKPAPENRSYESQPAETPKPDAAPPKEAEQQDEIIIISYTEVVGRNEMASIKIKGKPNTEYDCDVEYKSGPSTAKGLEVKRSDKDGYVSWTWKVGSRTSTSYRPTITISGGNGSISVTFEVTE